MYLSEDIRKAVGIYNYLQSSGEMTVKDNRELFEYYGEDKVKEILSLFEDEAKVKIVKYDDTIYFIPDSSNEFLGFKRSELKKEIFMRSDMRNIDLFLEMYILIQLTAEFYSGKGSSVKIRDFITIGELDEKITERLLLYAEDEVKSEAVKTGLAINEIAKYWLSLINEDNASTLRTRRWYIDCLIKFLKKENLLSIQDETVIIPTAKFNRLAVNYFLNYDRLDEINRILNDKDFEEEDVNA